MSLMAMRVYKDALVRDETTILEKAFSHPVSTPTMAQQSLAGKKIVIAGASRGIGAYVARALAAYGPAAIVIGYASRKDAADALIADIQKAHGTGIALHAVGGAIVDHESAHAFAKQALDVLGGELDILLNIAGVMTQTPLTALTQADYDYHFRW
jgi:3-oxoacyl-[acyl-carrier protein] reductase